MGSSAFPLLAVCPWPWESHLLLLAFKWYSVSKWQWQYTAQYQLSTGYMVDLGGEGGLWFSSQQKRNTTFLVSSWVVEIYCRSRGKLRYYLFVDFTRIFECLLEMHVLFGNKWSQLSLVIVLMEKSIKHRGHGKRALFSPVKRNSGKSRDMSWLMFIEFWPHARHKELARQISRAGEHARGRNSRIKARKH